MHTALRTWHGTTWGRGCSGWCFLALRKQNCLLMWISAPPALDYHGCSLLPAWACAHHKCVHPTHTDIHSPVIALVEWCPLGWHANGYSSPKLWLDGQEAQQTVEGVYINQQDILHPQDSWGVWSCSTYWSSMTEIQVHQQPDEVGPTRSVTCKCFASTFNWYHFEKIMSPLEHFKLASKSSPYV